MYNFKILTEYLNSLTKYGIPAFDCKIMRNHEVIYRKMAGYKDYEKQAEINENTVYRMFSATKLFTVTAVMQLIENGKLGLYDELTQYLPEFGELYVADYISEECPMQWTQIGESCHISHKSIRIIDLLTMTAGFSYNTASKELMEIKRTSNNQASTREVVKQIAKMPLLYEPSTRWAYGLEHDVLAAVIEIVTGMKFSEYLEKFIWKPLGIENLYFHWNAKQKEEICSLYMSVPGTEVIIPDDGEFSGNFKVTENYESGGAGLAGTVDAYSVFADTLANWGVGANGKRILSENMVRFLMTGYTTGLLQKDFESTGKAGYSYGLGVRVLKDSSKSKSPIGEFGWDGAAGAYVLIDSIHRLSIFYTQHVIGFDKVYTEIHPVIRDLTYNAIEM